MSKNIPKPIVRIGHVKKDGSMSHEIDGNKIKNMSVVQFNDLIIEFSVVKRKLLSLRGKPSLDFVLTNDQYEEIETMLKEDRFLVAVKLYKQYANVGLYDAKNYVDNLKILLK